MKPITFIFGWLIFVACACAYLVWHIASAIPTLTRALQGG